ncbi:carboxymuconolactone decarboxylase family protein [Parafrankia discariae]|uniref:carboxymuconolactone decarboxylase family protein n=1 Tax=Parafrankia discariae TaxID=365528 RepID=UPI0012B69172|nr:carboxymuconolactone decarboxylase family protein [Parafrankia discariae]
MPETTEPTAPPASLRALRAEVLATLSPAVAAVAPDVGKLAASFAYGEIWPRAGLSPRDRSIATVAALVTLNCTEELRLHTLRALANGVTKEEIGEILTQLTPYVGFPLVVSAAAKIADLVERATPAESPGGTPR